MSTSTISPTASSTTASSTAAPAVRETVRPRKDALALAGLRIVAGFLFACHGLQGLVGAFGGVDGAGGAVPFGVWPGWWASAIALAGGVLVLLGLVARPAALICSGAMAYAYFTVHQPMGLLPLQNLGEQSVLFCWIFLLVAVAGPGAFALGTALRGRRS